MDVGAQPDVISQPPADVIGSVVNHDIIIAPVPVISIIIVVRCHTQIKTPKPETLPVSAFNPVNMPAADFGTEASMFPGMIHVVVGIIPAGVVPNPPIILRVHVRRFGMTGLIAIAGARVIWLPATVTAIRRL
jgi:hypothetical protein